MNTIPPTYYTDDAGIAAQQKLILKIMTKEGKVLWTEWEIFRDLEYFQKLRTSGMEEVQNQELKFELKFELTLDQAKIYLNFFLKLSKAGKTTYQIFTDRNEVKIILNGSSRDNLIAIFEQADYHQWETLFEMCCEVFESLLFTQELYEWNFRTNYFTMDFLTERLIDLMAVHAANDKHKRSHYTVYKWRKLEPIFYPPQTDTEFWGQLVVQLNGMGVLTNEGKLAERKKTWFRSDFLFAWQSITI